jgi:hypothetical protein
MSARSELPAWVTEGAAVENAAATRAVGLDNYVKSRPRGRWVASMKVTSPGALPASWRSATGDGPISFLFYS